MRAIPFLKMQGAGNDFVFLNRAEVSAPVTAALARRLLDRHFGIGADQLIVYTPGTKRHVPEIRFFNADGSEAEMCGNGMRAAANYLREAENRRQDFIVRTKTRAIGIGVSNGRINVDMGEPVLEGREIPVAADGPILDRPLTVGSERLRIHAVSMGNPHCVIFVPRLDRLAVAQLGPRIERHPFFPRRVNVEFVEIRDRKHLRARVWERGAGETLACGTGACAIAVAAARAGKAERDVTVELPGGDLRVRWANNNRVYLSGPSANVFKGEFFL